MSEDNTRSVREINQLVDRAGALGARAFDDRQNAEEIIAWMVIRAIASGNHLESPAELAIAALRIRDLD